MSIAFAGLSDSDRKRLRPAPFPDRIAPMLATLTDEPFSHPDWIYERKLDGYRCLAFVREGQALLTSRNGNPHNHHFPEIAEALRKAPDVVLDGEVVAFVGARTSFEQLQQRLIPFASAEEASRTGIAVFYYVFDILYLGGFMTETLPLRARKGVLRRALAFRDPLRYTPHRNRDGVAFLAEACAKGWEGLIAKDARAPYEHRRSRAWLKFKCGKQQEFAILGFTDPQGARTGLGALVVGYRDGDLYRSAGKVGTGFDQAMLGYLHDQLVASETDAPPVVNAHEEGRDVHWVEPRLVCEVGFTEWTKAGKLRHPRFLGLRPDKSPREVVREAPVRPSPSSDRRRGPQP